MIVRKNNLLPLLFCLPVLLIPIDGEASHPALHSEYLNTTDRVVGKVVEAPDNAAAGFATIAVLNATDSSLVGGAVADEHGAFVIAGTKAGKYIIRVSNMGFKTLYLPGIAITEGKEAVTDLGVLSLVPDAQRLNEVVVTADRSTVVEDIDKKSITIGADLLATSNNASEILEKLPAVSLDENGSPQVRGKGNVIVLIDGKPSTQYGSDLPTILQSFPANLIERIDVMTTPSAKYEGDGASGVIDIITKGVRIRGMNGNGRLNAGNQGNHGMAANGSFKSNKLGLSAAVSADVRNSYWDRNLTRTNYVSEKPTGLFQRGDGQNQGMNLFGRLGANYAFNEKSSLEASVNYTVNGSDNYSWLYNETTRYDGSVSSKFERITDVARDVNNANFNVDFRHKFDKKEHMITFTANYSMGGTTGGNDIDQLSETPSLVRDQYSVVKNTRGALFLNSDYTLPVNPNATLEMGIRGRFGDNDNSNVFYTYNTAAEEYQYDRRLSNVFNVDDQLYTGFVTFSQKSDLWGVRAGLRLTDYYQSIEQITTGSEFDVHFLTLIPSLALSRKLGTKGAMTKLNYSRTLQRPEAIWLNPYTDVSDPRNIQSGNPNLKPESVHKVQLSYSSYEASGGWGPSLFMDYSNDAITRIRTIDEEGISYTRYDNVGREVSYGFETDFSHKVSPKLRFTMNGRVFRSEVVSEMAQIDNRTWSYAGNLNAFITLPLDLRASAYINYEGPRAIAQGIRDGVFVANMGVRKVIMKKKGTVSFNVRDVILSRNYKNELQTPMYDQTSYWHQTSRLMNLTFQYRFGKISSS